MEENLDSSSPRLLSRVWLLVVGSSVFYLGSEWLFFVTKPSVLSGLSSAQIARVLLVAPLALALVVAGPALALAAVARVGAERAPQLRLLLLAASVPAAILAGALILLVDNFTYTVFGFGLVNAEGVTRLGYAALMLALFAWSARVLARQLRKPRWLGGWERAARRATWGFVAVSAVAMGLEMLQSPALPPRRGQAPGALHLVNVIVFSADGVDAHHLSAYGYERDTTPHLKSLVPDSLVFENHFSNSAKTTGAIGALLTGKLPTTTRVIFRPDTFRGAHAYQHLPGLLRSYGYTTGDFSVRHFADARDLDLRESFHRSMGRNVDWGQVLLPAWGQRALPATSTFLNSSYERLGGRVLHAFGVRDLENAYELVTAPEHGGTTDRKRVEELEDFIRTAERPFFAHIHLLSTHGPIFKTEQRVFSGVDDEHRRWHPNPRDDAILQMDRYLEEVSSLLLQQGIAGETLLIVTSDHGSRWSTTTPIPLVMHYPGREHSGVQTANSQRIDIAPTILDFIGIARPEWMEGRSLLSDEIDPLAPIVSVSRAKTEHPRFVSSSEPPFYTLGRIYVNYCDVQYRMHVDSGAMIRRPVEHHTAPCPEASIPSEAQARRFLVDHLAAAGYDVSGLSR